MFPGWMRTKWAGTSDSSSSTAQKRNAHAPPWCFTVRTASVYPVARLIHLLLGNPNPHGAVSPHQQAALR